MRRTRPRPALRPCPRGGRRDWQRPGRAGRHRGLRPRRPAGARGAPAAWSARSSAMTRSIPRKAVAKSRRSVEATGRVRTSAAGRRTPWSGGGGGDGVPASDTRGAPATRTGNFSAYARAVVFGSVSPPTLQVAQATPKPYASAANPAPCSSQVLTSSSGLRSSMAQKFRV